MSGPWEQFKQPVAPTVVIDPTAQQAPVNIPSGTDLTKMGPWDSFKSRIGDYVAGVQGEMPPDQTQATVDRVRRGLGGQMAADLAIGAPLYAATRGVGMGPGVAAAVSGGAQSGMLPAETGMDRAVNIGAGAIAGKAGQWLGNKMSSAIAPVKERASQTIQDLARIAEEKFGFKLSPGQRTNQIPLLARENRWMGDEQTLAPMVEIARGNAKQLNRYLSGKMGVAQQNELTDDVVRNARQNADALFNSSLKGSIELGGPFDADVAKLGIDRGYIASQMRGTVLDKFLKGRRSATQIDAKDYNEVRKLIGQRARADEANSWQYYRLQDALDNALERTVASGKHEMSDVDLNNLAKARGNWRNILMVEQARHGSNNPSAANVSKAIQDFYPNANPDNEMRQLLSVLENVPEMKFRVGQPAQVSAQMGGPRVSAAPGAGMQAFFSPGRYMEDAMQPFYLSKPGAWYYAPADPMRRIAAALADVGTQGAAREGQLDYVTKRTQ